MAETPQGKWIGRTLFAAAFVGVFAAAADATGRMADTPFRTAIIAALSTIGASTFLFVTKAVADFLSGHDA